MRPVPFNAAFVARLVPRLRWAALLEAAESVSQGGGAVWGSPGGVSLGWGVRFGVSGGPLVDGGAVWGALKWGGRFGGVWGGSLGWKGSVWSLGGGSGLGAHGGGVFGLGG